jgi:hypothetical protein
MAQPFDDVEPSSSKYGHYPLDQFLRRANSNVANIPYLLNLRKVYIFVDNLERPYEYDDHFDYVDVDFVACVALFNHLTSIESIDTDALIRDSGLKSISRLKPRSSNITGFHLNHCCLPTMYHVYLIQCCRKLREFRYNIGGRRPFVDPNTPDMVYNIFDGTAFMKSIFPHKDKLEVLDFDVSKDIDFSSYDA